VYNQWIDAAGDDLAHVTELREERDEQAKLIEGEFQLKRDEELARVLQADEDHSQLPNGGFNEQDGWDLPDRSQPVNSNLFITSHSRPSRTCPDSPIQ
jgi:hypothetical protein